MTSTPTNAPTPVTPTAASGHDTEKAAGAIEALPSKGDNVVDKIIASLGDIGAYQIRVYLLSCLPVAIAGSTTNSLFFITQAPPHRCYVAGCDSPVNETSVFSAGHMNFTIPKQSDGVHYQECDRYSRSSTALTDCSPGAFLTNGTVPCDGGYVFDHEYFKTTLPIDVS